ncbi:hypothetical protein [Actinoallomurus acaciae]|uniref:PH domain-containing protein n=1 Tax=Actinoallomurus acaciae TaxID=502577 RepID=A0ABV5YNK4_9ACTN
MTFPPSSPPGPYVVRERSSRWILELPVAVVFGAGWYLFSTRVVHASALFALAGLCLVGYGVFRTIRPAPTLEAGPDGFRLGKVSVPWTSIRAVVIVLPTGRTGPSPAVEVGLRLHHGAPLPAGMDSVVYDPGDSNAMQASRSFGAGRVDPEPLAAAVVAYGRVAVVESAAGAERRIG